MTRLRAVSLLSVLVTLLLVAAGGYLVYRYRTVFTNQNAGTASREGAPAKVPVVVDTKSASNVPAVNPSEPDSGAPLGSIADLKSSSASPASSVAVTTTASGLPQSGPELNLAALSGTVLAGGGAIPYLKARRRLKKGWSRVDIL